MTILKGTHKKDVLNGGVANDLIIGYNNNDVLNGNAGNDTLKGGNGADFLNGGLGNDILNGGTGVDKLMGGDGNDSLIIHELNGDVIDGGAGIDNLKIDATNETFDLTKINSIKNIEAFRLASTHSTLILDAQSTIDLSTDSNTLKVDASDNSNTVIMQGDWVNWNDKGIINNYHVFINGDATLQINPVINHIQFGNTDISSINHYTVSNVVTANEVKNVFTSGIDEITVDFGGEQYSNWGLNAIDLTGFGLEDKLIITSHDGSVNKNNASNLVTTVLGYKSSYYSYGAIGFTSVHFSNGSVAILSKFGFISSGNDTVLWQQGITNVKLISHYESQYTKETGNIQLTGLPANLPVNHFAFV